MCQADLQLTHSLVSILRILGGGRGGPHRSDCKTNTKTPREDTSPCLFSPTSVNRFFSLLNCPAVGTRAITRRLAEATRSCAAHARAREVCHVTSHVARAESALEHDPAAGSRRGWATAQRQVSIRRFVGPESTEISRLAKSDIVFLSSTATYSDHTGTPGRRNRDTVAGWFVTSPSANTTKTSCLWSPAPRHRLVCDQCAGAPRAPLEFRDGVRPHKRDFRCAAAARKR